MTKEQFVARVESDRLAKVKADAQARREVEKATIYYFTEKKHKRACAKKRRIYS